MAKPRFLKTKKPNTTAPKQVRGMSRQAEQARNATTVHSKPVTYNAPSDSTAFNLQKERAAVYQEIARQKELGPFLPNDVAVKQRKLNQANQTKPRKGKKLKVYGPRAGKNINNQPFLPEHIAEKLNRRNGPSPFEEPKKHKPKKGQQKEQTQNQQQKKKEPKLTEEQIKTNEMLDRLDFGENTIGSLGHTFSTGFGSLVGGLKKEGALKKAGIGIAQSSAASAVGHAGLAAIQGEDPWEAAKTGAVRGAFVGTGYQSLKIATGGQDIKGIKNTLSHIKSTSKQMYKAHTLDGNLAMRDNVSNQLKRVLEQNERAKNTGGIFGLKN